MAVRPRVVPGPEPGAGTRHAGLPGTHVLLGILPLFTMAAVAAVDVIAGPGVGFLPLLSLGPALAAVSLRPAQTAFIGGLAMAVCAVLAAFDDLGSRRVLIALATIAGVTAAGAVASAGRHRRERDLANLSAVAEAAQRVLLRPVPSQIGAVGLAVRYMSAAAAARIGGDLYEVVAAEGKVRLIVGDVQGKGLAAVQTAATVLGAFREAAPDAADLGALAARIELSLQRQPAEEEFVTAILAQIPDDGSRVEILNCGHPPPLLRSGPAACFIEPRVAGLPFGLARLAAADRLVDTVTLCAGDQILLYTDGISEARDKTGTFYQLSNCKALLDGLEPGAALDRLCDDVIRHVGHQLLDDAAMLLISRIPRDREAAGGHARASNGHPETSVGSSFAQARGQETVLEPGHARSGRLGKVRR
ncbi:MAG: PP2C family protein-serine/threonine phosphatase [Micromonosporaceae bacterium]